MKIFNSIFFFLFFQVVLFGQFSSAVVVDDESSRNRIVKTVIYDMDMDGDNDLVVLRAFSLGWYENTDGSGTFGEFKLIDDDISTGNNLKIIDWDMDGLDDIIIAIGAGGNLNSIQWFKRLGSEVQFDGWRSLQAYRNLRFRDFAVADFDNNGWNDIVHLTARQISVTFKNSEISSAEKLIARDNNLISFGYVVDVHDVDDDGDQDILLVNGGGGNTNKAVVFENLGEREFQETDAGTGSIGRFFGGNNAEDGQFVDLNLDGKTDILMTFTDGSRNVVWFENIDGFSYGDRVSLIPSGLVEEAISTQVSDLDLDGDMDLIVIAGENNKLQWFENDGSNNFEINHVIEIPDIEIKSSVDKMLPIAVGDLNSDGKDDIVFTSYSEGFIGYVINNIVTSSIYEVEKSIINIYPNPFPTQLYVNKKGEANFDGRILGLNGAIYSDFEILSGTNTVNLDLLPSGIYILEVRSRSSKHVFFEKIIKL